MNNKAAHLKAEKRKMKRIIPFCFLYTKWKLTPAYKFNIEPLGDVIVVVATLNRSDDLVEN